jgi:hypothetical protein
VSSVSTEGISLEEEHFLWSSGILNVDSPKALLRCVFYLNGKNFCLIGGQEHRDLHLTQLKRFYNPDKYVYTEHASKNRPGGLMQLRLHHKSVDIHANSDVGERCHVFILDKYISKLPQPAIEKDIFYCKPKDVPVDPSAP